MIPGEIAADGSVFIGFSSETRLPVFTTYMNSFQTMDWRDALGYALGLRMHGRMDWRLPSMEEMDLLFKGRDEIGGFEERLFYWCGSPQYLNIAWATSFKTGDSAMSSKARKCNVRCVRDNHFNPALEYRPSFA